MSIHDTFICLGFLGAGLLTSITTGCAGAQQVEKQPGPALVQVKPLEAKPSEPSMEAEASQADQTVPIIGKGLMFGNTIDPSLITVGTPRKEVIRSVVAQHHESLRSCYERGLVTNPALQGKVIVRFIISADGDVPSAKDHGSELEDKSVVACVVEVFATMKFEREGGVDDWSVVYPIVFQPGE